MALRICLFWDNEKCLTVSNGLVSQLLVLLGILCGVIMACILWTLTINYSCYPTEYQPLYVIILRSFKPRAAIKYIQTSTKRVACAIFGPLWNGIKSLTGFRSNNEHQRNSDARSGSAGQISVCLQHGCPRRGVDEGRVLIPRPPTIGRDSDYRPRIPLIHSSNFFYNNVESDLSATHRDDSTVYASNSSFNENPVDHVGVIVVDNRHMAKSASYGSMEKVLSSQSDVEMNGQLAESSAEDSASSDFDMPRVDQGVTIERVEYFV